VPEPADILISVADVYVTQILNGLKTVELRRRTLRISPGTRIWIYAKSPRSHVQAVAIADQIVTAPPEDIWRDFKNRVGISFDEFTKYFDGTARGCAVLLKQIGRIDPEIPLNELRQRIKHFHPPQFFKKLKAEGPEVEFFKSRTLSTSSQARLPKPPDGVYPAFALRSRVR